MNNSPSVGEQIRDSYLESLRFCFPDISGKVLLKTKSLNFPIFSKFNYFLNLNEEGKFLILEEAFDFLLEHQKEPSPSPFPGVVFAADNFNIFVCSTALLINSLHLEKEIAIKEIKKDKSFKIWNISNLINEKIFNEFCKELIRISESEQTIWTASNKSLPELFNLWTESVLAKKENSTSQKKVEAFFDCLLNRREVLSSEKTITTKSGNELQVQKLSHFNFWKRFREFWSEDEVKSLTEEKDRLVDEKERRMGGEFFTPSIWVKEAHKHLDSELGEDWRDEYFVWDCSCGMANLTRDFKFKNLFLSTLNQEDVNLIKSANYNDLNEGKTIIFQYDFLNDSYNKLPEKLRKALENPEQKFLFLNNPPYGTSSNRNVLAGIDKKSKSLINKSKILDEMKKEKIKGSAQLYTQFMYRMAKLTEGRPNVYVGLFSKSFHIRSYSFKGFSDWWTNRFHSKSGFLFRANEFADVSGTWAVCWNLWKDGPEEQKSKNWKFKLKESVNKGLEKEIKTIGIKKLYIPDWKLTDDLTDKEYEKERKTEKVFWRLTGAVSPKSNLQTDYGTFFRSESDAGYYTRSGYSSSLAENQTFYAASSCAKCSTYIPPTKIKEFATGATLRAVVSVNWKNEKDEPMQPNKRSPLWDRWVAESLLYFPLCPKAEFSSLRNLHFSDSEGNPHVYHVKNHWALLSKEEISDIAKKINYQELLKDLSLFSTPDRMVTNEYEKALSGEISELAKEVFVEARDLVRLATLSGSRRLVQVEQPHLHLEAWDAGWKQLTPVLMRFHEKEYKAWKEKQRAWTLNLREMVYDLGYLHRDYLILESDPNT